jgi:hypothetical protein
MRNSATSSAITRAVLAGLAAAVLLITGGVDARAGGVGAPTGGTGGAPVGGPQVPTYTKVTCIPGQVYSGQPLTPCTATTYAHDGTVLASPPVDYTDNVFATSDTSKARYSADYVDRSGTYAASSTTGTFDIAKAPASATVSCPPSVLYTGSPVTPCTAIVKAGGAVTSVDVRYTNNTGPGLATAAPDLGLYRDPNFYITNSSQAQFTIGATTTVTVSCTAGSTYTGSALTPCSATATASDGFRADVPVTYGNNTNAGTATASATYAGDGTGGHLGSTGSTTFAIAQAPSFVAVTCPVSVTYTGADLTPCTITATGAGSLTDVPRIKYSVNRDAGTAEAYGYYSGDDNHLSSNSRNTFTIDKAPVVVTVTCPSSADFTGAPLSPCTASVTGAGGLAITATVTYSSNVYAGTATASATFAGDANHLSGTSPATTFQVKGFTLIGYDAPLEHGPGDVVVWNQVMAGSSVPLKFRALLPDGTPITSTGVLGATFTATPVACVAHPPLEGGVPTVIDPSNLKFDAGSGRFVLRWKTSRSALGCYRVTTTSADHTQLSTFIVLR